MLSPAIESRFVVPRAPTFREQAYIRISCWVLRSCLSITRIIIVIVVLAIRQCAAWRSTLITHTHSRKKKTTEIRLYFLQSAEGFESRYFSTYTGWFKHKTPNSFRGQYPRRWELGSLVCRTFFLRLQTEVFVAFKLVLPRKERKSSRVFSEWVWLLSERCTDQFLASWFSQFREFKTSSFFNVLAINIKKSKNQTEPPFLSTASFLTTHVKKELNRNSRNCDSREAENWSGYLSKSSQTHSKKARLDFLALRGKHWLESKKKLCS